MPDLRDRWVSERDDRPLDTNPQVSHQESMAGSRSLDRLPAALQPRLLDFDNPAGLPSAFAGAQVVLLISAGQAEDDAIIARHAAAIDAAEVAG